MPKQLRIAIISVHSCPVGTLGGKDTGGMNVYIQEIARELGRRGHAVDIYTRVHQPEHRQLINLGQNVRLIHLEAIDDEEMPKIAIYSYIQKFACGIESFRKAQHLHYDLIHSHYWLSGLAGKQLRAWWDIPHMVMFHTLGAVKNSINIGEDEPELRIEGEREVVGSCDRIVAATEREKQDLVQHYGASPSKIAIIPCGVNLDLFQPIDKGIARKRLSLNHEKVILCVGRIDPLKGLDQLLKALTHLNGNEAPALMVVGGDQHSQNEVQGLQRMVRELHIEDQVSFVGSVAQERLPLFYSAADICVIPSYYESFGMVALESLSCGTPILATDVGGIRCIIRGGEAGRIVEDNSPHQLASKISDLLSQTEDHARDVEIRRAMMTEFSWANITEMILREYDRVLRDCPAGPNL